jgi:PhzF family phenazine biosynthesis protein
MASEIPIYQIDAFASRVFAGNPAAVCPLEDWLPDEVLQGIGSENNLAETAFFVHRQDGDYDLRWFTPAAEVDLCGHATLAGAYVIDRYLEPGRDKVRFHTASGPLDVTREEDLYTLDFPAYPPAPAAPDVAAAVAEAIGSRPLEVLQAKSFVALLTDEAAVRAADPDLNAVTALPGDGLIITAPGEGRPRHRVRPLPVDALLVPPPGQDTADGAPDIEAGRRLVGRGPGRAGANLRALRALSGGPHHGVGP